MCSSISNAALRFKCVKACSRHSDSHTASHTSHGSKQNDRSKVVKVFEYVSDIVKDLIPL